MASHIIYDLFFRRSRWDHRLQKQNYFIAVIPVITMNFISFMIILL